MRRSLPRGLAGVALLALPTATVVSTAFAYFTTTGVGDASAGVSTLSAPSITAATPEAGGAVALTWTPVTPPGPGTVTYYVTRNGGKAGGSCPSASSPASGTTCTDSGLTVGAYQYVVTARWRSWTTGSSTSTAKITIGAVDHLTLTATSSTPPRAHRTT
jgi:hypothetical protein